MKKSHSKESHERDLEFSISNTKIQQLNQEIQQLKDKNHQLLEEVHSQTALVLKYSKNYRQQSQKSKHLQYIINQIQKQAQNAKFYWGKAFKQQVQKIKQLEQLNRQLRKQNIRLSSQISSAHSQHKQQDLLTKFLSLKKQIQQQKSQFQLQKNQLQQQKVKAKQQFTILLKEKDKQIGILQQRLKTFQLKEGRWNQVAREFKREKEEREARNNELSNEVSKLREELQRGGLKPQNKSSISNQSAQLLKKRSLLSSHERQQQCSIDKQQNKDPFEYIRKLSQLAQLPQNQILIRQGDYYLLNHSNIEVQMQQFLSYDWQLLQQINFYNAQINNKKWKRMVEQHLKFPNLQVIYLLGNDMRMVDVGDVEMFDKLASVVLPVNDQIKGMKASSKLKEDDKSLENHQQVKKQVKERVKIERVDERFRGVKEQEKPPMVVLNQSKPKIEIKSQPKLGIKQKSQPHAVINSKPQVIVKSKPTVVVKSSPKVTLYPQPGVGIKKQPKIEQQQRITFQ